MKKVFIGVPFFAMLALLQMSSCSDPPSKPKDVLISIYDPKSTEYTDAVTLLDSVYNFSDTLTVPNILLKLKKSSSIHAFRFKLDKAAWTTWDSLTTIFNIDDLDEGEHELQVMALHINKKDEEKNPKLFRFTVNAVRSPALMFSSRKKLVSFDASRSFTYNIVAEEVKDLYGLKASVTFNPAFIAVDSVKTRTLAQNSLITPVLFSMISQQSVRMEMLFSGGNPMTGFTGSDTVITVYCRAKQRGNTELVFYSDSTQFRNIGNIILEKPLMIKGKLFIQ